MSRILVALDGSPGSEKALQVAIGLAQQNGGQVTAVTVLDRWGLPALSHSGGRSTAPSHGPWYCSSRAMPPFCSCSALGVSRQSYLKGC
jgi:Universal stress protein family